MKKFFVAVALVMLTVLSSSVQAARPYGVDIYFDTYYSQGDKYEYYFGLDTLKEDFDNMEISVGAKLVVNGRLGHSRPHKFRLVNGVWFATQTTSSSGFDPINSNRFYSKLFDALTPYSKLAQTYPR